LELEAEEVRVGDVIGSGGGGVVADRDGEEVERPADGGAVDFALGHLAVAGDRDVGEGHAAGAACDGDGGVDVLGVGARAGGAISEYDFVFVDPVGECASAGGGFSEGGRAAGVGDAPCGDAAAVIEFDGPPAAGDEQAVIEARLGRHGDKPQSGAIQ